MTLINRIRDVKGNKIMDPLDRDRIIRNYYKQLHANKSEVLEKMDRFLYIYYLPKLNPRQLKISIDL